MEVEGEEGGAGWEGEREWEGARASLPQIHSVRKDGKKNPAFKKLRTNCAVRTSDGAPSVCARVAHQFKYIKKRERESAKP